MTKAQREKQERLMLKQILDTNPKLKKFIDALIDKTDVGTKDIVQPILEEELGDLGIPGQLRLSETGFIADIIVVPGICTDFHSPGHGCVDLCEHRIVPGISPGLRCDFIPCLAVGSARSQTGLDIVVAEDQCNVLAH